MRSAVSRIFEGWNHFWFSPQPILPLGLMRILLGASLFWSTLVRHFYNMSYFQESTWVSRSEALKLYPEFFRPTFGWFFWPDSLAIYFHGLLLILLLMMILGLSQRPLMILTWILHLGFLQRNYAIGFGGDLVGVVLLFYLSFTDANEVLTLKSRFFKRKTQLTSQSLLNSVGFRMIQVHISIIYAYTGFEKLKGVTWWNGTALWNVLINPQMVMFDMSFMKHFPWLIAILTYLTLIFEIYWPLAMLQNRTRQIWLVMGLFLHLGIAALMNMCIFSLIMISTYFLFLPEDQMDRIRRFFQRTPVGKIHQN